MRFRAWGLGFWASGFWGQGLGLGVWGLGPRENLKYLKHIAPKSKPPKSAGGSRTSIRDLRLGVLGSMYGTSSKNPTIQGVHLEPYKGSWTPALLVKGTNMACHIDGVGSACVAGVLPT